MQQLTEPEQFARRVAREAALPKFYEARLKALRRAGRVGGARSAAFVEIEPRIGGATGIPSYTFSLLIREFHLQI
jgi:hypothetical protein